MPKQDLVGGLRVMLEKRDLGLPLKYGPSRLLAKEMAEMETWMGDRGRAELWVVAGRGA